MQSYEKTLNYGNICAIFLHYLTKNGSVGCYYGVSMRVYVLRFMHFIAVACIIFRTNMFYLRKKNRNFADDSNDN